jgi:hypothetical protein
MDMKQIIKLFLVLSLVLLASCSTQQRVVYRDCDCNTTTFGFGWNTNPYWGWNNPWRWNNPYWSWTNPHWGWNNWYWRTPSIVRPNIPSRYERKQTIGTRPSRNGGMESSQDNLYYTRPSRTETRTRSNYQYYEPSQRTDSPTRSRTEVQSRPSTPSRVESSRPSRSYTPQVQQRTYTPSPQGTTPSRRGNQNNQEK